MTLQRNEGRHVKYTYNDGGRAAAGYCGITGDCVTRAIAIVTGLSYARVYRELNHGARWESPSAAGRVGWCPSSARMGVRRIIYEPYLRWLGWAWTPTMAIGSGCRVHLRAEELPPGRLIVSVSRHLVAVIDGVIHDTHDCSRNGSRCVYGYYSRP